MRGRLRTGLDFTRWPWEHVGIDTQLGMGYMFKVADVDSNYPDGHSFVEDKNSFFEYFASIGTAIR